MYGIFTYIWLIFIVNVGIYTIHVEPNVGKYTIHGCYGIASFQVGDILVSFWSHMPHEDLHPQPGDCHVDGPAAQGGMSGDVNRGQLKLIYNILTYIRTYIYIYIYYTYLYIYIKHKLFLVNDLFEPNQPLNHTNLSITFPIGSMYIWCIYLHLPSKSTIHVIRYAYNIYNIYIP